MLMTLTVYLEDPLLEICKGDLRDLKDRLGE